MNRWEQTVYAEVVQHWDANGEALLMLPLQVAGFFQPAGFQIDRYAMRAWHLAIGHLAAVDFKRVISPTFLASRIEVTLRNLFSTS